MKRIFSMLCLLLCTLLFTHAATAQSIKGAWQMKNGGSATVTLVITDDYFMQSAFDKDSKAFYSSLGGKYKDAGNGMLEVVMEFNTEDKNLVGQTFQAGFKVTGSDLQITVDGDTQEWTRIDDGKAPLQGVWRISQREQEGKMNPITLAPRRTLKILSGSRFQWAAINIETGEFFGTGGGTYTFKDGKYTENIEFFSRDSSRVGMSLSFDGKLDGDNWHHSGLSSKGDKISEIWTRTK
ncbi:hypothetical protein MKQ68_02430 [Chitinophaga horti]|uniref:Membrane or secreted protein n=1 Tax=Chitinophaga horti TaxID=2920382 RepID=A0ABY6J2R6_9BACT|nr:hypothetical protein [Chitinophaga horti]UYQ93950.1 hypothetical protein MKQ68_02430 [Chitinophaga horti]